MELNFWLIFYKPKQCQGRDRKPQAERNPKGEHRTGEDRERSDPLTSRGKNKLGSGWLALFANRPEPHGGECGVWGSAPRSSHYFWKRIDTG